MENAQGILLFSPEGDTEEGPPGLAPRVDGLEGRVAGLLFNNHHVGAHVWHFISEFVRERTPVSSVVATTKPNTCAPAPMPIIEELAKACDFAIVGVCG